MCVRVCCCLWKRLRQHRVWLDLLFSSQNPTWFKSWQCKNSANNYRLAVTATAKLPDSEDFFSVTSGNRIPPKVRQLEFQWSLCASSCRLQTSCRAMIMWGLLLINLTGCSFSRLHRRSELKLLSDCRKQVWTDSVFVVFINNLFWDSIFVWFFGIDPLFTQIFFWRLLTLGKSK